MTTRRQFVAAAPALAALGLAGPFRVGAAFAQDAGSAAAQEADLFHARAIEAMIWGMPRSTST